MNTSPQFPFALKAVGSHSGILEFVMTAQIVLMGDLGWVGMVNRTPEGLFRGRAVGTKEQTTRQVSVGTGRARDGGGLREHSEAG